MGEVLPVSSELPVLSSLSASLPLTDTIVSEVDGILDYWKWFEAVMRAGWDLWVSDWVVWWIREDWTPFPYWTN